MISKITKDKIINNDNLIVPIAYDEVFREIFGNPKNIIFTEYLISALLNIPYDFIKNKVSFKTRNNNNINVNKKRFEKDIVVTIGEDESLVVNLEMNLNDYDDIKRIRNTKYISDIFSSNEKDKKKRKIIKQVIQFNFNTNYTDKKNNYIYDEYLLRNKKGNILTNKIQIINLNVAKMSDLWYSKKYKKYINISKVIFWFGALIMENEKIKLKELINDTPIDNDIAKNLESEVIKMNDSKELYGRYYNPEEEKKYWDEVREEYAKEKIQQEIVRNMYNNNMNPKTISNYTNIPISTVEDIISRK